MCLISRSGDDAMPLKKGTSNDTVGKNVKKLVHEWEQDGAIGSSHPATKKKAVKQAVAISLNKRQARAGRSKKPAKPE
jgi:hypothetical protein